MEAERAGSRPEGIPPGVEAGAVRVREQDVGTRSPNSSSIHSPRRQRAARAARPRGPLNVVVMFLLATILFLQAYVMCTSKSRFAELDGTNQAGGTKARRLAGEYSPQAKGESDGGSDSCFLLIEKSRQDSLRRLYTEKRTEELAWKGSAESFAWAVAAREASAASPAALREFEQELREAWGSAKLDWILRQKYHLSYHDLHALRGSSTLSLPSVGVGVMSKAMKRLRLEQSTTAGLKVAGQMYRQSVVSAMASGSSAWESQLRERVAQAVHSEVRRVSCAAWRSRLELTGASREQTLQHHQKLLQSWSPGEEELTETEKVIKRRIGAERYAASQKAIEEKSPVVKAFRAAVEENERYALERLLVSLEIQMETEARGWTSEEKREALEERLPWSSQPSKIPVASDVLLRWLGEKELKSRLAEQREPQNEPGKWWWQRFSLRRKDLAPNSAVAEEKSLQHSQELPFTPAEEEVLKLFLPEVGLALPDGVPQAEDARLGLRVQVMVDLGAEILAGLHAKKATLPSFPRSVDVAVLFVENRLSQAL